MYSMLIALLLANFFLQADKADLIIFSYDRPLQLYACLESAHAYFSNLGGIYVVYRISNAFYEQAYTEIREEFRECIFVRQDKGFLKKDFKPLVRMCLAESSCSYCLFAVDDIIFTGPVDCNECIRSMEKEKAYAFFLRLGEGVDCTYPDVAHPLPNLMYKRNGYITWDFIFAEGNWACIHNLDATIYRKKDVLKHFDEISFQCPNTFEGEWGKYAAQLSDLKGICCVQSKAINIPLNQVQECDFIPNMKFKTFDAVVAEFKNQLPVFNNNAGLAYRNLGYLSPQDLLDKFNQGLKINIATLNNIVVRCPHIDYIPQFIPRK